VSRLARIALVLAALAVLAAAPAGSGAHGPTAHASKSCGTGSGRGLGPTYAFRLKVQHTSCRNGRKLIRAYNDCRHSNGGRKGRCSRTLGYSCSEKRFDESRLSFDANVKCSKGGGRRINHTYTQNLR
jgi:hypothetical protein